MVLRAACFWRILSFSLLLAHAAGTVDAQQPTTESASPAQAEGTGAAKRGEIRELKLGLRAEEMSTERWEQFACGSNGSAPRRALTGWKDFDRCAAEPSGLKEVYVKFDSRPEVFARATDNAALLRRAAGTKVSGHEVILSALFDSTGVVRGIRIVTDPRVPVRERRVAHMLRLKVLQQYDKAEWVCEDFPPGPGETPVGGMLVKNRCEQTAEGRHLILEGRFYRKAGQLGYDPATGEQKEGDFESSTRLEIYDPAFAPPRG